MRHALLPLLLALLTACGGGEPEPDDVAAPDAHRPAPACERAEACR